MVARDLVDLNILGPSPKDFTSIKLMVTLTLNGIPGGEISELSHTFNSYTLGQGSLSVKSLPGLYSEFQWNHGKKTEKSNSWSNSW